MKKSITLWCILCVFTQLFGQNNPRLPQVIPPSPNAVALAAYADIPVSHYTGVPNINIPLYDINIHGYNLALSLSYHASGVKVNQDASWVGLGWVLNGGGVISRTVKGADDFVESTRITDENQYTIDELMSKFENAGYKNNLEPDIFYYNFGVHKGKFILGEGDVPMLLDPSSNLKISIRNSSTDKEWLVCDEQGTRFYFTEREYTRFYGKTMDGYIPKYDFIEYDRQGRYATSWYLTKIELLNGEQILLEYDKGGHQPPNAGDLGSISSDILGQERRVKLSHCTAAPEGGNRFYADDLISPLVYYYSKMQMERECFLKSIEWNGGKIEFETSDRLDIRYQKGFSNIPKKLDLIKVYSEEELLKSIYLGYEYFNQDAVNSPDDIAYNNIKNFPQDFPRLKLKRIEEHAGNSLEQPLVHSFNYYNEYEIMPPKNSNQHDHWGNFNNNTSTIRTPSYTHSGPIPSADINRTGYTVKDIWDFSGVLSIQGADRTADINKMKMGTLASITYPTGGICKFYYEANSSPEAFEIGPGGPPYYPNHKYGGGLRISKIETDATTRLFDYEDMPVLSSGLFISSPEYSYITKYDGIIGQIGVYFQFIYLQLISDPIHSLVDFHSGVAVGYSRVREIVSDGINSSTVEYTYHNEPAIKNNDPDKSALLRFPKTYSRLNGLPKKITYHKSNGIVQEEAFKYSKNRSGQLFGISMASVVNQFDGYITIDYFNPAYYPIESEWVKLDEKTITKFGENSSSRISIKETYEYNEVNHKPKSILKTINDASYKTEIKYPLDFPSNTYYGMVSLNMIGNIVEQTEYLNGIKQHTSKTEYKLTPKENGVHLMPAVGEKMYSKGNSPLESRIKYEKYDSYGNPVYVTKDGNTKIVYLWSFNGRYPIAEINNATYDEVNSIIDIENLSRTSVPNVSQVEEVLRNALTLSKSFITTYAYKPMVGITSIKNPQSISTTYEYDGHGRLRVVRDHNGNVLQAHEYSYANR